MADVGAIIGAATGVAGGVVGGLMSAHKAREARRALAAKEKRVEAQHDLAVNRDYTKTSYAQAALNAGKEALEDYAQNMGRIEAVNGGSSEVSAQAKNAATKNIADATTNIANMGREEVARADQLYDQQKGAIENARIDIANNASEQAAKAGSQILNAGLNFAANEALMKLKTGRGLMSAPNVKKVSTLSNSVGG